jgi:anti-sigma B factor antagonist
MGVLAVWLEPFSVERSGGTAVLAVAAGIDISSADLFRDLLLGLIEPGLSVLIADMSATTCCDSSCVNALVVARRRAVTAGTELRLATSSAAVLRVLEITGLDRIIPVFATTAAALARPCPAAGLGGPG